MRIGAFTFHHGCYAATGWQKKMTLSVAVMTSTACMLVGLHTVTQAQYIYNIYIWLMSNISLFVCCHVRMQNVEPRGQPMSSPKWSPNVC